MAKIVLELQNKICKHMRNRFRSQSTKHFGTIAVELLIIYINDIPQVSKIDKLLLYAGDANIIISGTKLPR